MIKRKYKWILIDKADMRAVKTKFRDAESVCFAMMNSGTIRYRDFSEFILIKNESEVVDIAGKMAGIGGDMCNIHKKVLSILLDS